jgi:hypothetical protein
MSGPNIPLPPSNSTLGRWPTGGAEIAGGGAAGGAVQPGRPPLAVAHQRRPSASDSPPRTRLMRSKDRAPGAGAACTSAASSAANTSAASAGVIHHRGSAAASGATDSATTAPSRTASTRIDPDRPNSLAQNSAMWGPRADGSQVGSGCQSDIAPCRTSYGRKTSILPQSERRPTPAATAATNRL